VTECGSIENDWHTVKFYFPSEIIFWHARVCISKRRENKYAPPPMKPSYNPNKRRRKMKIGFRARMATAGGRATLSRRRFKKRKRISA
jgi:large subunit ribosomal protein L34